MLLLSFSPSPAGPNARACTIRSLWGLLGLLACAPPPGATSRARAPATRRTSSLRVSLSLSLSLSHPLGLSVRGLAPHARSWPPPHALSKPSCVYTPAGQLHSDGAACVLVSRTHARIHFASMRTGHASNQLSLSLFLSPAGPNLCAFARAPGPPSILNGSLAQTISLFAPKPNLSNSLLCTIFSPQSNKISLFKSSYQQYHHRAEHGSVHHHSMGAVCPAHIQVLEESFFSSLIIIKIHQDVDF